MRYLYDLDVNRHPAPDCFGAALLADAWPDATTPRTERPVRFGFLSQLGPEDANGTYTDLWYTKLGRY